jgi:O-antigen/teichoic acid export membrane protein
VSTGRSHPGRSGLRAMVTEFLDTAIARCYDILPTGLQLRIDRVRASPLAYRLVRGSFWSLTGSVISRGLALAATVLAARLLGKSSYGELGIIQSTVAAFGTLAGFGMGTTSTKCVAQFRLADPNRTGRVIGLCSMVSWVTSGILAAGLVALAPWLSRDVLSAPHLSRYLQAGSILLLLSGINGAQNGTMAGFEAFKATAQISAAVGIMSFPLVVGGAYAFGLPGVVAGLILAQAIGCFMNFLAVRREAVRHGVRISYSSLKPETAVIWQFSVPAVLGILLISPMNWICNAMLVRQPNGLGQMGALTAASQWFGALTWLPYMLSGVTLSMLSERLGAADGLGSVKLLRASVVANAAIAVPVAAIGSLLSPYIMRAYGVEFRTEWPTLVVTLLAAAAAAVQIPIGVIIAASNRMWIGLLLNLGWATVLLTSTSWLVHWGSLGVAVGQLLAYSTQGLAAFAIAGYVTKMPTGIPEREGLRPTA